ncbi:MAG: DinB family protein, partial [Chloroflexota bacterium]
MLAPTMLLTMFQYNHDINTHLINKAAEVTPEQWDAGQEADQRSLHETLFHILAVEEEWLFFCQTTQPPVWGWRPFSDYPDVPSLNSL